MAYDEFSLPKIFCSRRKYVSCRCQINTDACADCRATAALEDPGFICRRQLDISHCDGVRRRCLATRGRDECERMSGNERRYMAVEEENWNSVTMRKQKIQREVFCLTVLSDSKIRPCNVGGRSKQNTQCMYKRNIEARSRNHCCSGKTISITYSECVCSLSYPACNAHAPYYIVICDLSGCTIFFRIIS